MSLYEMPDQAPSIEEALKYAPETAVLAALVGLHITGDSEFPYHSGRIWDPDEGSYNLEGYLCLCVGLLPECVMGDDMKYTNTGFGVAADGGRIGVYALTSQLLGYRGKGLQHLGMAEEGDVIAVLGRIVDDNPPQLPPAQAIVRPVLGGESEAISQRLWGALGGSGDFRR